MTNLRTSRPRAVVLLSLFAAFAVACAAGTAPSADGAEAAAPSASAIPVLDSARLLSDLARLSHDSMAGRANGSPENEQARVWIAAELERIGLERVNGTYVHPFVMARRNGPDSIRGANVLGMLRGTGDGARVIVVSAHFDHVGTRDGEIFNGTDDNASGTSVVLAMAAHFAKSRPAHTIIFAFFDAEEVGLVGARAFVASPPVPLAQIAANVNLDMVSRNDKGELYAAGASPYPQFRPILDALVPHALVTLRQGHDSGGGQNDWTSQSDQGAFHAAQVPFVYFGVEDHPDYHKPSDDFDKIEPGFFYRSARTIAAFVVRLDAALPPR